MTGPRLVSICSGPAWRHGAQRKGCWRDIAVGLGEQVDAGLRGKLGSSDVAGWPDEQRPAMIGLPRDSCAVVRRLPASPRVASAAATSGMTGV